VREARPDFAAESSIALDGIRQPVKIVRGELTAEFEVLGRTSGTIQLTTPAPVQGTSETKGRSIGLAVATAQDPLWPTEPAA
jgi:hypothetical protein